MPVQNHVILREIVEVTVPGAHSAQAVQATLARVLRAEVPALVEQRCDAWSSPGTILRLDMLVVDLGHLPLTGLEEALTDALATTFPARLDEAMHGAKDTAGGEQRVAPAASALELVGHFLRTGTLPWWVGRPGPGAVAENLRLLCHETPPDLLPNLRAWVHEPSALARLVRVGTDDDLRRLLTVLRPADAEFFGALPGTLCALAGYPDHLPALRPEPVRFEAWQSVLIAAARPSWTERAVLLEAVVRRVSTSLQWPARALTDALSPWSGSTSGAPQPVSPGDDFSLRLTRLHASDSPLAGLLTAMDRTPERLPAGLRADFHALLAQCEQDEPWPRDDFYRWLREALAAGALPPRTLQRWLDEAGSDRSAPAQEWRTVAAAALTASHPDLSKTRAPTSPSRLFDDEALSVDNAGLVILWPFLSAFFTHLGLVVEKHFPDELARHRAVALLQFLLLPEPEPPPEYFLPLNKVLCGLLPTDLFEPGAPVTDEEQVECTRFLTAVIANAPVLRDMSLPGFRGTFLARQGRLSTRDGTWLLRVERETYDVVLERFPWTFQWVRLPWMDAPMFVEW